MKLTLRLTMMLAALAAWPLTGAASQHVAPEYYYPASALVCKDTSGRPVLREVFEALHTGVELAPVTGGGDYMVMLKGLIARLKTVDPRRAENYERRAQALNRELKFISFSKTQHEHDSPVPTPRDCSFENIFDRPEPAFSDRRQVFVDQKTWHGLPEEQKALALFHELVAEDLSRNEPTSPREVRRLVLKIAARGFEHFGVRDYVGAWNELSLSNDPSNMAVIWRDGVPYAMPTLRFHPNGAVQKGRVPEAAGISQGQLEARIQQNTEIEYRQDGGILKGTFDELIAKRDDSPLVFSGPVAVGAGGFVESGILKSPGSVSPLGCAVRLPAGTNVQFHENGTLSSFQLGHSISRSDPDYQEWDLCRVDGRKVRFTLAHVQDRGFQFFETGQVRSGFLASPVAFKIFDGEYEFAKWHPVQFDDLGRVRVGQLKLGKVRLTTVKGDQRDFLSLPVLVFDELGRVIREQ